jgi:hypothetical protein
MIQKCQMEKRSKKFVPNERRRNMKAKKALPIKDIIVTIRIDSDQNEYLAKLAELVEDQTGHEANRTWVILQLMKHGKESFEQRYGITTKKKS